MTMSDYCSPRLFDFMLLLQFTHQTGERYRNDAATGLFYSCVFLYFFCEVPNRRMGSGWTNTSVYAQEGSEVSLTVCEWEKMRCSGIATASNAFFYLFSLLMVLLSFHFHFLFVMCSSKRFGAAFLS